MTPCSRAAWCDGMKEALVDTPVNHEGRGLSVMLGWPVDGKGRVPRVLGVVYRRFPRHDGIVLNVCPWCGAPVNFHEDLLETKGMSPTELTDEEHRVLARLRHSPAGALTLVELGTNARTARSLFWKGLVRSSTGSAMRNEKTKLSLTERS